METKKNVKRDIFNPSLEDVIDSCKREFERLEEIIAWLKTRPVKFDAQVDYALMRKFKKRITDTKNEIRMAQTQNKEDPGHEDVWITYLQDYLKWVRNTYLVMSITQNDFGVR